MTKESVLSQVTICKVCHKAFIPEVDVCYCPEAEEPKVDSKSFDDVVARDRDPA